ncbi:hypothetical protein CRG98_001130 [Punica granatum]|uniref:Retrotransposon gag domain-containing protein n=1 Tax=Punica granatum TaxID=22663 RepID=A0A2I0LCU2_PUNGR|nr:hypothetical protein CRG98_001130 [Punica granatum]
MAEDGLPVLPEEVTPPTLAHLQSPAEHTPTPVGIPLANSGAPLLQVPPQAVQTSSTSDEHVRIAALKGTVNLITANMAELMALLRNPNHASSSSTPHPGHGPKAMSVLPLVSMPAPALIYTAPPPMVVLASTAFAPAHTAESFSHQAPPSNTGLLYQAPSLNITSSESGTPIHAAPVAPPTNFLPKGETEEECKYWDYEEFIIHTFQDSLTRPAINWFMQLKAEDISTWADLSRRFIYQYQFYVETPPTLMELSTKEMVEGYKFEDYATKWRAQVAKHVLLISEAQQIQLFHSTLKGVYYSHLLAHTFSCSSPINAGKKLDMGIKIGRIEGPTGKKEGESSEKVAIRASSTGGKKGKETSVNVVNPGCPGSRSIPLTWHLRCRSFICTLCPPCSFSSSTRPSRITTWSCQLILRRESCSHTFTIMRWPIFGHLQTGPWLQELHHRLSEPLPHDLNKWGRSDCDRDTCLYRFPSHKSIANF